MTTKKEIFQIGIKIYQSNVDSYLRVLEILENSIAVYKEISQEIEWYTKEQVEEKLENEFWIIE